MLVVQLFEPLFDFPVDMVGVFGLNLDDDRQPRLATDEGRQAAGAGWTEDRITFEVPQSQSLFDHLRPIADPRGIRERSRFSPSIRAFAAAAQERFPVLATLIPLDPGIDRLR